MIRHVVLLKFLDPADAPEAKERLEALPKTIPAILTMTVGLDVLRTAASYDVALITTHEDVEGLKAYQEHPVHVEFSQWLRPRLEARAVVDHLGEQA